jgi:hyperosmotically inducible periplasmic protein
MNIKKRLWPLLFVFGFTLLFAACKPSDEKIAEAVKAKVSAISPSVSSIVKDGVVTLSGEVADEAVKAAVVTALQGEKGIKDIVNNLTVTPPPPPPPVIVINPDDVLSRGIDSTLSAKGFKGITSKVSNGEVTLTGTVKKSDLQKVMQAANEMKPKKVVNQLVITK